MKRMDVEMRKQSYVTMMVVCAGVVSIVAGAGCGIASSEEAVWTVSHEIQVPGPERVVSQLSGAEGGVAPSEEAVWTVSDEIQVSGPERVVTQLPMRSEDLLDLAGLDAVLSATCHASAACPGFDSCAAWSSTVSCGTTQCGTRCVGHCTVDPITRERTCLRGINRSTFTERFRVCFNAQQQACTEFQLFAAKTCQTSPSGDCCSQSPDSCGSDL